MFEHFSDVQLLPIFCCLSSTWFPQWCKKERKKKKKKSGAIISFCFSIINCLNIKDTVLDLDFEGFNGKQHL